MIKYDLRCDHDHTFEVWFRDSSSCDTQLAGGEVLCPQCASTTVQKALMAPSVAKSHSVDAGQNQVMTMAQQMQMLREFRRHVEQNSDDVGAEFPAEARRIHYGEAEHRNIYGEADLSEVKELIEEGIDIAPLPGPFRDDA
jgi:hypothetical protein